MVKRRKTLCQAVESCGDSGGGTTDAGSRVVDNGGGSGGSHIEEDSKNRSGPKWRSSGISRDSIKAPAGTETKVGAMDARFSRTMDTNVAARSGVCDTGKEGEMQPRRLDRQNPFAGAHDNSSDDGGSDQNPAGTTMTMLGHTAVVSSQLNLHAKAFVPKGSMLRRALRDQAVMNEGKAAYDEGPCKKKRTLYFNLDSGSTIGNSDMLPDAGLDDAEGDCWQNDDWQEDDAEDEAEDWMYDEPAPTRDTEVEQEVLKVTAANAVQEAISRQKSTVIFSKAKTYQGCRKGMYFGRGSKGMGYYHDDGMESCCSGPVVTDIRVELPRAVLILDCLVPAGKEAGTGKRESKPTCSGDPSASTPSDEISKEVSSTGPSRKQQKVQGRRKPTSTESRSMDDVTWARDDSAAAASMEHRDRGLWATDTINANA